MGCRPQFWMSPLVPCTVWQLEWRGHDVTLSLPSLPKLEGGWQRSLKSDRSLSPWQKMIFWLGPVGFSNYVTCLMEVTWKVLEKTLAFLRRSQRFVGNCAAPGWVVQKEKKQKKSGKAQTQTLLHSNCHRDQFNACAGAQSCAPNLTRHIARGHVTLSRRYTVWRKPAEPSETFCKVIVL